METKLRSGVESTGRILLLVCTVALWLSNAYAAIMWRAVDKPLRDAPAYIWLALPFTDSVAASLAMLFVIPLSLSRRTRQWLTARALMAVGIILNLIVMAFWLNSLRYRATRGVTIAEWTLVLNIINALFLIGSLHGPYENGRSPDTEHD
jgi:hypothetical protein